MAAELVNMGNYAQYLGEESTEFLASLAQHLLNTLQFSQAIEVHTKLLWANARGQQMVISALSGKPKITEQGQGWCDVTPRCTCIVMLLQQGVLPHTMKLSLKLTRKLSVLKFYTHIKTNPNSQSFSYRKDLF